MPPRIRLILVAVAIIGVGAVAVFVGRSGTGGSTPFAKRGTPATPLPAQCLKVPNAIETPSWFPRDLPLPRGSFATEVLKTPRSVRAIAFAVPASLQGFVRHALDVWPRHGWKLGAGETEPGEAEDSFVSSDKVRYGKFVARSVYCGAHTYVLLQLVLEPIRPSPGGS